MAWVKYWDDSFDPVPISRLGEMYDAGYRVWARYVGMGSAAKHWTSAEMKAWRALGDDTGCAILAEAYGTEPLEQPSLGDDHAKAARGAANALGVPRSVSISPAMDRNITMTDAKGPVSTYCKLWKTADGLAPTMYIEMACGGYLYSVDLSNGTFVPAAYSWDPFGELVTPSNAPAHVVMTQEHNGKPMAGGTVDIGHVRTNAPHVWWTTQEDDVSVQDVIDGLNQWFKTDNMVAPKALPDGPRDPANLGWSMKSAIEAITNQSWTAQQMLTGTGFADALAVKIAAKVPGASADLIKAAVDESLSDLTLTATTPAA